MQRSLKRATQEAHGDFFHSVLKYDSKAKSRKLPHPRTLKKKTSYDCPHFPFSTFELSVEHLIWGYFKRLFFSFGSTFKHYMHIT